MEGLKKHIRKLGIVLWFIFFLSHFSAGMQAISWVYILIELAVLILVPLGLKTLGRWQNNEYYWLISAALFTFSFYLETGILAGICASFWLFFAAYLIIKPATNLFLQEKKSLEVICETLTFLFLSIAAAWAFSDRINFQPLQFDPIIVLLTAAHFHYAGFLLTLITTLLLKEDKSKLAQIIGWFVVLGIPFVATGITTSKLGLSAFIEVGAATIMALGGIGISLIHFKKAKGKTAILWCLGALGLGVGMVLAMMYGWRFVFPQDWLVIPRMYAWHGTLNSISLGLLLLGYRFRVLYSK